MHDMGSQKQGLEVSSFLVMEWREFIALTLHCGHFQASWHLNISCTRQASSGKILRVPALGQGGCMLDPFLRNKVGGILLAEGWNYNAIWDIIYLSVMEPYEWRQRGKRTKDIQRGHERRGSELWLGTPNHMNLCEFFLPWVSLHGNGVLENFVTN